MKLKCDEPLSNFAFNFNLRRYSMVGFALVFSAFTFVAVVGRCRLTPG